MKEGVAKATAGFEATQTKMKEGIEKAMKTAEELVAFSQGNMEAIVKSGQIWAAGVQDLSKHIAAAAQASLDESMSAFKALTGVKSLKDAFELQSSFRSLGAGEDPGRIRQADRRFLQADRAGAGADHRPGQRRGREVRQGRLISHRRLIRRRDGPAEVAHELSSGRPQRSALLTTLG